MALIKQPGKVVSEYLSGVTISYAHPFRFIFVWATISTLIAVYTGASQGVSIAIGLPIMMCYFVVPVEGMKILGAVSMIVGVLVVAYVNSNFFRENIFLAIFKYILIFALMMVLFMILGIVFVLIHILLIKYVGFENVYEGFKTATAAAKASKS